MSVSVEEVFNIAVALMDELSSTGETRTNDTKEYEYRTPGILNMMLADMHLLAGDHVKWTPVEEMDDTLAKTDDTYARGVMCYGLASNLLTDENPTAASFYQQRYEELRDRYFARQLGESGEVENLYGGIEYGRFSRW